MPTYNGQAQEVLASTEWTQGQAVVKAVDAFVEWRGADGQCRDVIAIVEWRGADASAVEVVAQIEWKLQPSCTGDLSTSPSVIVGEVVSGGTLHGELVS